MKKLIISIITILALPGVSYAAPSSGALITPSYQGVVVSTNATSTLTASSSPTVASITATSTTLDNIFAGTGIFGMQNIAQLGDAFDGSYAGYFTSSGFVARLLSAAAGIGLSITNGTYTANILDLDGGSLGLFSDGTRSVSLVDTAGIRAIDAVGNSRFTGYVSISSTTPWAQLAVNPTAGTATHPFVVGSSTATHFLVANNGRTGVGTTSPSAKISIKGDGTTTGRAFAISNSANVEKVSILDNGKVSIGTPISTIRLTVNETDTSASAAAIFRGHSDGGFGTKAPVTIQNIAGEKIASFGGTASGLTAGQSDYGVMTLYGGANSATDNFSFGSLQFINSSGEASGDLRLGFMDVIRDGDPYQGTYLFGVRASGGSFAPYTGIKHTGNFFVGDTSFVGNARLSVKGAGEEAGNLAEFTDVNSVVRMSMLDDGTTYFSSNVGLGETSPASKLSVSGSASIGASYDTTTSPNDGLIVEGNVGIGTTSPASKFHVSAGASATTTVDVGAQAVTAKTCFNVRNTTGAATSFYFVGTTMVVEANRCR